MDRRGTHTLRISDCVGLSDTERWWLSSTKRRIDCSSTISVKGWVVTTLQISWRAVPTDKPFPHADVFSSLRSLKFAAAEAVSSPFWRMDHGEYHPGARFEACSRRSWSVQSRVPSCQCGHWVAIGPGATGDWFARGIGGRRLWSDRTICKCYREGEVASYFFGYADPTNSSPLPNPIAPRLHPFIETKDQWHFNTRRVCGADGVEYSSARKAKAAGADVVNCGQCSRCSSLQSVDAMHARAVSLTRRASLAGVLYLIAGESVHWLLMRSSFIGFDRSCADCWLAATQCNLASCAQHCLYGWTNPLSVASTVNGSTSLNACMQCDELHCSAFFSNLRRKPADSRRGLRHQASSTPRARPRVRMLSPVCGQQARLMEQGLVKGGPPDACHALRNGDIDGVTPGGRVLRDNCPCPGCTIALPPRPRKCPLPSGHYITPRRFLLTGCASGMDEVHRYCWKLAIL